MSGRRVTVYPLKRDIVLDTDNESKNVKAEVEYYREDEIVGKGKPLYQQEYDENKNYLKTIKFICPNNESVLLI